MESKAIFRNCPVAPRKMRLVADNVRGKDVVQALNILQFTRKEGAFWIKKTLTSAIANWAVLHEDQDPDAAGLYVKEIRIDAGLTLKRIQPAPQGRAHPIRKHTNHIYITVGSKNAAPVVVENVEA